MGRTVALQPRLRRRLVGYLLSMLIVVLSGCASTGDPATTTAEVPQTTTENTDSAASPDPESTSRSVPANEAPADGDAASDESTVNEVFVSPIGEALGVAQDEIATASATYVADAEELVRSCMAEAGFDYAPIVQGFDQQLRQQELRATLSPEQFNAEYGFGIATLFELNFKGQGVIDFVNERFGPPPSVQRSAGEQAAYELALNGQTTEGLTAEQAQDQLFDDAGGLGALEGSCREYGYSTAENPGAVWDLSLIHI